MASSLAEIVIDTTDPEAAARFWCSVLGWELQHHEPGHVPWCSAGGDPVGHDLKLVFVRAREGAPLANRLYVSPSGAGQDEELRRLARLGAVVEDDPGSPAPWRRVTGPGGARLTVLAGRPDPPPAPTDRGTHELPLRP